MRDRRGAFIVLICLGGLLLLRGCPMMPTVSPENGSMDWYSGDGIPEAIEFLPANLRVSVRAFSAHCEPIAGVEVVTSIGPSCVTDAEGICWFMAGTHRGEVDLELTREGFDSVTRIVTLHEGEEAYVQAMMPGRDYATTTLESEDSGTVLFSRGSVTFAAGSFRNKMPADTDSSEEAGGREVSVRISSLDVTGNDLLAAPGDFSAVRTDGSPVLIESFGMVSVELLDEKGLPTTMTPGTRARIELLVPKNMAVKSGISIPAWHFDEGSGRWIEEGAWTVGPWTQDSGRMVFAAEVEHFSWWNVDQPMTITCVSGTVTRCDGEPVGGAPVHATGVDYNAVTSTYTASDGAYCVPVRVGSTVDVEVLWNDGSFVPAASIDGVETPPGPTSCAQGPCAVVNVKLPCTEAATAEDFGPLCGRSSTR